MSTHMPSYIASAVQDPKVAPTLALESALSFADSIPSEDFDLLQEEYARRTGSPDFPGTADNDMEDYLSRFML